MGSRLSDDRVSHLLRTRKLPQACIARLGHRYAQCHMTIVERDVDQVQPVSGNRFEPDAFNLPDTMRGVDDKIPLAEWVSVLWLDLGGCRFDGGCYHRRRHWCRSHPIHPTDDLLML